MQLLYLTRTLSVNLKLGLSWGLGLLLLAAMPVTAQSTLESLPQSTQDEISRVCLPVQFREGAGAYRNCVQAELELSSSGEANDMARLSFDDKYAVQQACAKAGGQSSSAYQSCVADQIAELNSISAPAFDQISEDELYVVQQTCFDAQSKQGAASYRQCLNTELQSVQAIPAADTNNLSMLNKNALQLRCSANASTASQYRLCIAEEYESVAGTEPTFLPVSTATQVVRNNEVTPRASVVAETATKLAEQNNTTLALATTPESESVALSNADVISNNDTSATMALPRNIIPQRAGANTDLEQPAAQTSTPDTGLISENTLRDATGEDLNTATEQQPIAATNAETRVISKPELVKALEEQSRAETQTIEPENSSTAAATSTATPSSEPATDNATPMASVMGLWQKFLNALASLDGIGWLVIAGVLALPALLLGLFSLIRRVKQPVETPVNNASMTERIEPGMQTRQLRHEREAAELFGEHDNLAPKPIDETFHQPHYNSATDVNADHDAATRIAMKNEQPAARPQQPVESVPVTEHDFLSDTGSGSSASNPVTSNYAWQSAFGHWLTKQPASEQMELCIEFLIYWVAYGDERYEPQLKKRLFTATDLSEHDQIKRWVLKQDVFAFSDVVGWLRSNASQKQLEQSITLVMALLVTENSITPVQNTLLRFLSDAFNIGKVELELRFEQAFGHPLPDMPRPDKAAWWAKQQPEPVQRWNSRALATRPELDQMMARLGLFAGFSDLQVTDAFRRAARRCHPDRFTELGARERALAEQRFIKFEEARDKLLGVSV